jgi:hypothetical protein
MIGFCLLLSAVTVPFQAFEVYFSYDTSKEDAYILVRTEGHNIALSTLCIIDKIEVDERHDARGSTTYWI